MQENAQNETCINWNKLYCIYKNRWRCAQCKKCISIRDGSFFSKSRLSLQKWLLLIHWWAWEFLIINCAKALEVDENTSCAVYQWLREFCSTQLLWMQIELGGQGQIVQIDESLFRHKPKVCSPQNCQFKTHAYNYIYIAIGQGKDNLNSSLLQNHRGRATRNEVRVFGLCDPSTQPALGYMRI